MNRPPNSPAPAGSPATLWLALVLLLAGCLVVAPAAPAADCPLVRPEVLPASSTSGAWTGNVLNLVDTAGDRIHRYTPAGRYLAAPSLKRTPGLQPFTPSTLAATNGRVLLQLAGGRLVFMDEALRPNRLQRVFTDESSEKRRIQGLFAWDVAGDDLVLCGDVYEGSGGWSSGYLRASVDDPSDFRYLDLAWDIWDPEMVYCRIGYDYIATVDDEAFILYTSRDGEALRIHGFSPDGSQRILPTDVGSRPKLPDFKSSSDYASIMSLIEESAMPAGLYAWEGALYVLSRSPGERGTTEWFLTKVDRTTGEIQGTGRLPSQANHLTVVPGKTAWGILEKGPVRGVEGQDSLGLRFPSAATIAAIDEMDDGLICD